MGKAIPYGVPVQIGKCSGVCCLKRTDREPNTMTGLFRRVRTRHECAFVDMAAT